MPEIIIKAEKTLNKTLISQYLLNKIINKKVRKGMKFVATYLGID